MSFMEAQITDKSRWIEVDGPAGTEWIPDDVPNIPDGELFPLDHLPEWLSDYCENREAWAVRMVAGYGVRSSAPGYLDCTPWIVYTDEEEAESAYEEEVLANGEEEEEEDQ